MIIKFLVERRSWLLFFLFLELIILFIAYLDSSIPFHSILYVVFIITLLFLMFVILRNHQETKFYKGLEEWEPHLDITTLHAANRPFEELVEDRLELQTRILKQEAFQHRARLEQEKDDLMSWIHEVKTPLTAMQLMLDRIEDATLKADLTYEWLRIHLLLDQQLHQKRIPFIQNDLFIEQISLPLIVHHEIRTLQAWCMQKGIGFEVELKVKDVLSDAKWLAFIIRQLLTNAVKYSDSSDITIESFELNGKEFLRITDEGRGIDAKDLPRIFEKGFTSTTNHQDKAATGMGLYLAKKAAQSLLITIDVDSTVGHGTVFTLAFPKQNEFHQVTGM